MYDEQKFHHRRSTMRRRSRDLGQLLTLLCTTFLAAPLDASTRPNLNWFSLRLEFRKGDLPRGVSLKVKNLERGYFSRSEVRLTNITNRELLVIKQLKKPMSWIGVFPRRVLPMFMLKDSKLYEWDNEGWHESDTGLVADSLLAGNRLRPFEREFRSPKKRKGKAVIRRRFSIPYYLAKKRHRLSGTAVFKVDYGYKSILETKVRFHRIPTPRALKVHKGWVVSLKNPTRTPVYFTRRFKGEISWVGKLPKNEIPGTDQIGAYIFTG